MIVTIIDLQGMPALKPENKPPVSTDLHGPIAFHFTFQLMQIGSRKIHVLDLFGKVQPKQHLLQTQRVFGLNTSFASTNKISLKTFVPEALDHCSAISRYVTRVN
jgi:hypothetical protein